MKAVIDSQVPEYELGVKDMDSVHMEFIDIVNKLANADKATFKILFAELLSHTETHFLQENNLMQLSDFPALDEHVAEHNRVLRDLRHFNERVQAGSSMLAKAWILDQVPDWFHLHALTMDTALAEHLKKSDFKKTG